MRRPTPTGAFPAIGLACLLAASPAGAAPAALIGAHFQGFTSATPQGATRNAFSDMYAWSRWARAHWVKGWNKWGTGWGYWAGPVFWPFLYGDALSFTLWPANYYDPVFAYGPSFLLTAVFSPGELPTSIAPLFDVYDYPVNALRYEAVYHGRDKLIRERNRLLAELNAAENAATCAGLAPGLAELPIDKIAQEIKPSDAQNQILTKLRNAAVKAEALIRASCPSEAPLTPVGRLDAITNRLHAMVQALDAIKPPLTALDQSLDDQQRERLAALGGRSRYRYAGVALSEAPGKDLLALCTNETASVAQVPVARIEALIKPDAKQKPAFAALQSASATAAANLNASCPYDMPETVADRINAVTARLDALNEAMNVIKPALTHFYATLSDEQKARFNIIGALPNTTSAQTPGD